MKDFPDIGMLRGNYAPVLAEMDAPELVVTGEMPEELAGTLYRNGPNPMFPPLGEKHHWFLGEGMVHGIHVEGGRASYRNRWVHTEQYEAQRKAGRRLVGTAFGEPRAEGGDEVNQNVANTNIVWHGNKLLALDEGSSPVAMNPETLETEGSWTFEGKYKGAMTAHPKIDPETGEMLFFAYMADGPGSKSVAYNVVDADGKVTRSEIFEAPYCTMMHDFITTDEHVIFPLFPATIDVERIMAGGPVIAWDPDTPSMIGIMRRDAPMSEIRWFEGDPCYVYHPMNTYTAKENGHTKVIADVMKYSRVPLFPDADGKKAPPDLAGEQGLLVRWTFDLDGNSNSYSEEVLTELRGEFPRLDERRTGLSYRHGFYASMARPDDENASYDTLVHIDLQSGRKAMWDAGKGNTILEPVFVPRHAGAEEGDGFIVTSVYRGETNLSDFAVFDARDVSAGPLALAHLPVRIPHGFHGNWRGM